MQLQDSERRTSNIFGYTSRTILMKLVHQKKGGLHAMLTPCNMSQPCEGAQTCNAGANTSLLYYDLENEDTIFRLTSAKQSLLHTSFSYFYDNFLLLLSFRNFFNDSFYSQLCHNTWLNFLIFLNCDVLSFFWDYDLLHLMRN